MEDKIRALIEEIDPEGKISEDAIQQLIAATKDRQDNPLPDGYNLPGTSLYFHTLKDQLANETDWRKKAAIAAKIISLNLE